MSVQIDCGTCGKRHSELGNALDVINHYVRKAEDRTPLDTAETEHLAYIAKCMFEHLYATVADLENARTEIRKLQALGGVEAGDTWETDTEYAVRRRDGEILPHSGVNQAAVQLDRMNEKAAELGFPDSEATVVFRDRTVFVRNWKPFPLPDDEPQF